MPTKAPQTTANHFQLVSVSRNHFKFQLPHRSTQYMGKAHSTTFSTSSSAMPKTAHQAGGAMDPQEYFADRKKTMAQGAGAERMPTLDEELAQGRGP
eukprot:954663-Rhodomonas_salina.1